MLLQKEAKQGKGEPGFPLCKPLCRLAVLATNLDFSGEKNPNPYCAQIRSKGSHGVSAPPPCGARKNLCACQGINFFDRCGCSASLHPPLAALGSAPPFPSPDAGEGDSIYNLYIKMRRRHLESVSAALYGRCFASFVSSRSLSVRGVLGRSPKRVLVWGPRRDARPAGERRSGGALEGCLSHRDSDPTWSKARDDAYAQKERPRGERC